MKEIEREDEREIESERREDEIESERREGERVRGGRMKER